MGNYPDAYNPRTAPDSYVAECLPAITNQLGWECVTDHPDPNTRTTVGLVWDDAYRCFFLDVCERKFGRSADESLEVPLSRDGLRRLVALAARMLGDRT